MRLCRGRWRMRLCRGRWRMRLCRGRRRMRLCGFESRQRWQAVLRVRARHTTPQRRKPAASRGPQEWDPTTFPQVRTSLKMSPTHFYRKCLHSQVLPLRLWPPGTPSAPNQTCGTVHREEVPFPRAEKSHSEREVRHHGERSARIPAMCADDRLKIPTTEAATQQ